MMERKMLVTKQRITKHLGQLKKIFLPGMRFTLIARHPEIAESDWIVTDDELPEVLKILMKREVQG